MSQEDVHAIRDLYEGARSQGDNPCNVRVRLWAVPRGCACIGRSFPDLRGYFPLDMPAVLRSTQPTHAGCC